MSCLDYNSTEFQYQIGYLKDASLNNLPTTQCEPCAQYTVCQPSMCRFPLPSQLTTRYYFRDHNDSPMASLLVRNESTSADTIAKYLFKI